MPAAKLSNLPELSFERNETFESVVQLLVQHKTVLEIDGARYSGFRFTAPEILDGPIEWLSVPAGTGEADIPSLVLSRDGKIITTTEPRVITISDFPRLLGQFPKIPTVSTYQIPMDLLERGRKYFVVQTLAEGQSAPVAVSITVASPIGRFQYGNLNPKVVFPPRQLTKEEVIAKVLKARAETGVDAAIAILTLELGQRADDKNGYADLYRRAWVEAQTGSGRLDMGWSAMLYDALFTTSWEHRYYKEAMEVASNLIGSLSSAGRSGRASEVLDWWCEAQRLGGYQMVPDNYPDLGPALGILPEVRKRDIPELKAFSNAKFPGDQPRTLDGRFGRLTASAFLNYSRDLNRAGRWRESMEWKMWIHQWASVKDGSAPRDKVVSVWYESIESVLYDLAWMGFTESAIELAEKGLAAPNDDNYHGRSKLLLASSRFDLLIDSDRQVPDIVAEAEALVVQAESNIHLHIGLHQKIKVTLAKALIHTGRRAEGMALLDQLVEEGSVRACTTRLRERIQAGEYDKVELELLELLKKSREDGNKADEILLYADYALFLEKTGRYREALLINSELLRLCRSFDYFTILPVHLACRANLLSRLGDAAGSKLASDEASALAAQGRLPEHNAGMVRATLAGINALTSTVSPPTGKTSFVDFQPGSSIVIPVEGASWITLLSLANPGTDAEDGTLTADGMPVTFATEENHGDILARLGSGGIKGAGILPLQLEPGSYQLIKITAEDASPAEGEVTFAWTSGIGKTRIEAKVIIELPESGVSSAVIQAGNYQLNPFYGVPIHHHYVTTNKEKESIPMRFVASQAARVEVYALDGTPLCIDNQGNGSLRDRGDQLFASSDRQGNLLLALKNGSSSFMVLLYPEGSLPDQGMTLDVEVLEDGLWAPHSQNRILH